MDPLTWGVLAGQAVGLIKSFLGKASEGAATKVGEATFNALKSKLLDRPSGKEALVDFENNPRNQDYEAALRVQIEKVLASDKEFATHLQSIVGDIRIEQHARDNATQYGYIGGNVRNSNRR